MELRNLMKPKEVDQWAREQDIPGLRELMAMPAYHLKEWFWMPMARYESIRDSFAGGAGPVMATSLVEQVRRRNARWAHLQALQRRGPPADPVVRPLWTRLLSIRLELGTYAPCPVDVRLQEEPPEAIVTSTEYLGSVRVGLMTGRPGYHPQGRLEAGYCDALLDRLETARAGDPLYDILARPQWARDLAAVRAAMAGAPMPEGNRRELGWRVSGDERLWVGPALFRRTRSGTIDSAAVKEIPEGLLADAVDDEVAMLVGPYGREMPSGVAYRIFELLIGHPRVILGRQMIEVVRGTLALELRAQPDGSLGLVGEVEGRPLDLPKLRSLVKESRGAPGVVYVEEGARIRVVRLVAGQVRLLMDAAPRLAVVPAEALDALAEGFESWGTKAGISLPTALAGEAVAGDPRPLVRLISEGGALTVELRVRPLIEAIPQVPGEGPKTITAKRGDRRVFVERDLEGEGPAMRAALALLAEVPAQGPWQWRLRLEVGAERDLGLSVIEAVEARPGDFQVEWSGTLIRTGPTVKRARLVLQGGRDWLGISGESEGVKTTDLLAAIAEGAGFVEVGRGTWARIDETLRAAVGPVAKMAAVEASPRLSELQATMLADLPEVVEVEGSASLLKRLGRVREAAALDPAVPEGLVAELRPYQVEGWKWLARLASWAPGAVLADDMGLGKTVQAIALLVERSALGPGLVVAPTSVVSNWVSELSRFGPGLKVVVFHGAARSLGALKAGVVCVTTWGLAQRDEALGGVSFATAILDEAQAIKNPESRRAKAAVALKADFKLALTGTPVENSALDLWSILRVTTPGLLPGREGFRTRWLGPIEAGDGVALRALAATTRPFVLRRTKGAVAQELPEKTEMVVKVGLSEDERLLYERARLKAVEGMGGADRFKILAALTRLRQLACHPRLVDAASPVGSSKIAALTRMLVDLKASGQRALVFSQFVELLELVEPALKAAGLTTMRLDGSTPMKARSSRVAAFQSGEGDVFLISLKAGGAGLNLTGASYVFHLDPWWNPASEDQATDRTHRIGQRQPVTVYRLVASGTIEEAILGLHADKRTLASDLLSGTESARPLEVDELMALLGGQTGGPAEGGSASDDEDEAVVATEGPTASSQASGGGASTRARARVERELVASGRPASPAKVVNEAALEGLAGLWASYDALIEGDLAAGRLRAPAAKVYRAAVGRFLGWAKAQGLSLAALRGEVERFMASESATATDRSMGRAGLSRLWGLMARP